MINQNSQGDGAFVVLMADDDPEDVELVADALSDSNFPCDFHSVTNGYELIKYLHHREPYADSALDPGVILLDLSMPKRNGTEVLAELKSTRHLRDIPIVILTTSDAERDRARAASLGANGYLTKPNSYQALVEMMQTLKTYQRTPRTVNES
jgi:CheY-like chemotaxis protein